MKLNIFKYKSQKSSFGIKLTYIFGITVCLWSIWSTGFDNKPLRDNDNLKIRTETSNKKVSVGTIQHHLNSQDLITVPIINSISSTVTNSITIPIEVRRSDGTGTAFNIGSDAWITARHVIHGCQKVYLSNKFIKNIYISPSSDLALLVSTPSTIDKFDLGWFPKAINRSNYRKDLVIGDDGYSIGFPKGKPGQARLKFAGYVQMNQRGAYNLKEPVKMWVEIERQPSSLDQMGGISGGPIFNKDGFVVGVHVANSIRKGRAFSVDEYAIAWLIMAVSKQKELIKESAKIQISDTNWSKIANGWRNDGRIKKVNCTI